MKNNSNKYPVINKEDIEKHLKKVLKENGNKSLPRAYPVDNSFAFVIGKKDGKYDINRYLAGTLSPFKKANRVQIVLAPFMMKFDHVLHGLLVYTFRIVKYNNEYSVVLNYFKSKSTRFDSSDSN